MRSKPIVAAFAALLAACTGTTGNYRDASVEMQTVDRVDLSRYAGRWYEIARFPNSFEEGCVGVTADYALQPDGKVSVVNTCRESLDDPDPESSEGVARPVAPSNSKLKVTFVPWLGRLAEGDYWILGLRDDYSVAVVGSPDGGNGWILARSPQVPQEDVEFGKRTLTRNGYDVSKLYYTPQPQTPYPN